MIWHINEKCACVNHDQNKIIKNCTIFWHYTLITGVFDIISSYLQNSCMFLIGVIPILEENCKKMLVSLYCCHKKWNKLPYFGHISTIF